MIPMELHAACWAGLLPPLCLFTNAHAGAVGDDTTSIQDAEHGQTASSHIKICKDHLVQAHKQQPSGKHVQKLWLTSPFFFGEINHNMSMAIFNSYVSYVELPEGMGKDLP